MRSKISLGSSREVVQGCGVSFVNCLYLVPLIIGQNFCATHATVNQTGPMSLASPREDEREPAALLYDTLLLDHRFST